LEIVMMGSCGEATTPPSTTDVGRSFSISRQFDRDQLFWLSNTLDVTAELLSHIKFARIQLSNEALHLSVLIDPFVKLPPQMPGTLKALPACKVKVIVRKYMVMALEPFMTGSSR